MNKTSKKENLTTRQTAYRFVGFFYFSHITVFRMKLQVEYLHRGPETLNELPVTHYNTSTHSLF